MNHQTYNYAGDEHELVSVGGEFTSRVGVGTVTAFNGSVAAAENTGVGAYTVTFRDAYNFARAPDAGYLSTATIVAQVTSMDPLTKTMTVQLYDRATGAAAEGAGGVQVPVWFEGVNTKARFRK